MSVTLARIVKEEPATPSVKYWAYVQWHGVLESADEEFTHVVGTTKGRSAALAAGNRWIAQNLSPEAAQAACVTYLGKSS